ncbi:MAG: cytochrome b/b6 domain-containing protein [Parvularculaceae bacterium]|nr:cytochrome b/b6 domain-containing protein [Parvularculaceae bacterium]
MTTDRNHTLVTIFDPALRLFHWGAAVLIPVLWWTAENGHYDWHRRIGLTMLGLVIFRILWGFIGPATARFGEFVKGPGAILNYVQNLGRPYHPAAGHNPLGALSVIALIAVLAAQTSLGLFAVDVDGIESGPLSHLVSFDTGREAAELHETNFKILTVLIVLHLGAIAFYRFGLGANLIPSMITGKRRAKPEDEIVFPVMRFMVAAAIAVVAVMAIVL